MGFLGLFGPKGALGSQKLVEEVLEFAKKIDDLQRNFVQPTLSNLLLAAQVFSNLATRWRSSTPDLYKILLIST